MWMVFNKYETKKKEVKERKVEGEWRIIIKFDACKFTLYMHSEEVILT
jgi:hypothetical protein